MEDTQEKDNQEKDSQEKNNQGEGKQSVNQQANTPDCPFCAILGGQAPGTVISRDDERGFALIQSIHPESSIHWMVVPVEHVDSTEEFEHHCCDRFLDMIDYAVDRVKSSFDDYPELQKGFTLKLHFGSYETIPHAKLHILATE